MSAFMCTDRHLAFLILARVRLDRTRGGAVLFSWERDALARLLKYENSASVACRYPGGEDTCPGCGEEVCQHLPTYAPEPPAGFVRVETSSGAGYVCPFAVVNVEKYARTFNADRDFDPVNIIKQAQCYEYQASEHKGWETSRAKDWIESLISSAIGALPGYQAAPWGLES